MPQVPAGHAQPHLREIGMWRQPYRTPEEADAAINEELDKLLTQGVTDEELQKAKNKIEAMMTFEDMSLLSRANNLAFYELLGDAAMINDELGRYNAVTADYLLETVRKVFRKENSNTLVYKKEERLKHDYAL